MSDHTLHGKPPVFSASSVVDALARALMEIKVADRLTFADMGAVLGKSEDQAAKYCDGSATMDAVTFGRGKREWNGRFTGYFDRLCVESRPGHVGGRDTVNSIMKAAAALTEAMTKSEEISQDDIIKNRAAIEGARDALDGLLRSIKVRAA